jgi:hypothetical protein
VRLGNNFIPCGLAVRVEDAGMPVALAASILRHHLRLLLLDQTAALAVGEALHHAASQPLGDHDADDLVASLGGTSGATGRVACYSRRSLSPCQLTIHIRNHIVRLTTTVQSRTQPLLLLDRAAAGILHEALQDAGRRCSPGED